MEPIYLNNLKQKIIDTGMTDKILLQGITDDVSTQLNRAKIFAFPSLYEGFPLALTEAMSIGLACIGCKDCPGVNEIITDHKNGILVSNDPSDFAKGLENLISDPVLCDSLGKQARHNMRNYSAEVVWNQWDKLVKEVSFKNN